MTQLEQTIITVAFMAGAVIGIATIAFWWTVLS